MFDLNQTFFFELIAFFAIFLFFRKFALPRLNDILDNRQKFINKQQAEAKAKMTAAVLLLKQAEEVKLAASLEVAKLKESLQKDIALELKEERSNLEAKISVQVMNYKAVAKANLEAENSKKLQELINSINTLLQNKISHQEHLDIVNKLINDYK